MITINPDTLRERVHEQDNESETQQPRAGERVLEFWCSDCETWHRASVLGGRVDECGQ